MTDTIIFDCEGVVIDTEAVWDHGQTVFLGRRGAPYERDRVKPLLTGRSVTEGTGVLKELFGLEGEVADLARERLAIVADLVRAEVSFIPGFLEFFERVRHCYQTAVATAMDHHLLALADERLELSRLFGGRIQTLAPNMAGKPAPDLFLAAASRLGAAPGRCVVIEDAPLGIRAARGAGMRSIGLATTYPPGLLSEADQVAASFEDIDLARLG